MRQSTINLIIFSLVTAGCAGVQRPDTVLYGVNGTASKLRGYNLRDYSDDGTRLPTAKLYEKSIASLKELNGWTCTDPKGLKNLKVFVGDLRDAYERERQSR